MKQAFLERHHVATFLVLVGLGVGLATVGVNSPYHLTRLQRLGLGLTSPLARVGSGMATLGVEAWVGLTALSGLHSELESLRTENRDLRIRLDALRESEHENVRLRRLLRLDDELLQHSVPARIIHRQTAPDHVLVIDRGSADGLREDLPVVAPGGIVGKILAVTRNASKVQCVSDPDAGVAVLVGRERRQTDAIVRDIVGDGLLRLRHLKLRAEVLPGDAVVSSGLDQVYPKGWPVGTVKEVNAKPGFEPEVWVRLAVELETLEEVLVLLPAGESALVQARSTESRSAP